MYHIIHGKISPQSIVNKASSNEKLRWNQTRIRDNSMQSLLLVLECFANSNIWSQTLGNNRVIWGTTIGLGRKQCVITACFPEQDTSASQLTSLHLLRLLSQERTFEIIPGLGKCLSASPCVSCCYHLLGVTRLSEPQQCWLAQVPGTGWKVHGVLTTWCFWTHQSKGCVSLPVLGFLPREKWVVPHCAAGNGAASNSSHPRNAPPQNCRGYTAD